jgi:hypothetical protein
MTLQSKFIRAAAAGAALVCGAVTLWSQPAARKTGPDVGRAARYSNPLPIETSSKDGTPQGISLGAVTVVREGDDLFATGGGALEIPRSAMRVEGQATFCVSPFVCQQHFMPYSEEQTQHGNSNGGHAFRGLILSAYA